MYFKCVIAFDDSKGLYNRTNGFILAICKQYTMLYTLDIFIEIVKKYCINKLLLTFYRSSEYLS